MSSDAVCVCVLCVLVARRVSSGRAFILLCWYVYVCRRRSHVASHAGCQGGWVERSSGGANGGSQLSSWISRDGGQTLDLYSLSVVPSGLIFL